MMRGSIHRVGVTTCVAVVAVMALAGQAHAEGTSPDNTVFSYNLWQNQVTLTQINANTATANVYGAVIRDSGVCNVA